MSNKIRTFKIWDEETGQYVNVVGLKGDKPSSKDIEPIVETVFEEHKSEFVSLDGFVYNYLNIPNGEYATSNRKTIVACDDNNVNVKSATNTSNMSVSLPSFVLPKGTYTFAMFPKEVDADNLTYFRIYNKATNTTITYVRFGGDYKVYRNTFTIQEDTEVYMKVSTNNTVWVGETNVNFMLCSGNVDIPRFINPSENQNINGVLNQTVASAEFSNVLYKKKWAVCGDSFSYGMWAGISDQTARTLMHGGKFDGKNRVYGNIIGNRNDMDVVMLASNGQTMATPSDGTFTNCFSKDVYNNIPNDVDYITLYFGINDAHHNGIGSDGEDESGNIPLGDITDTTTSTFCGAYNVVLDYLIRNYPFAHIGIIVTNGLSVTDYRDKTIAIANKYGIPYIDLNGDRFTPCMLRSCNTSIAESIRNAKNESYRCTSTNLHPNPEAHEYESTFIENFLRSL